MYWIWYNGGLMFVLWNPGFSSMTLDCWDSYRKLISLELLYLYFLGFFALDVIRSRLYSLGILNDGEDDQFISGLTVWTVRNAFRGFIHQSELVVYLPWLLLYSFKAWGLMHLTLVWCSFVSLMNIIILEWWLAWGRCIWTRACLSSGLWPLYFFTRAWSFSRLEAVVFNKSLTSSIWLWWIKTLVQIRLVAWYLILSLWDTFVSKVLVKIRLVA